MIPNGSDNGTNRETMPPEAHPPVPRLTVRVGVTGHRKAALPLGEESQELRRTIRAVLEEVQRIVTGIISREADNGLRTYSDSKPSLRLISPLAEGADQIVAVEALNLGMELHCPLPFDRKEYVRDFPDEASKKKFLDLLSRADRIFELDGPTDPDLRQEAYEMVGRTVLRQSDVLIAIWDQDRPFGIGGTGHIVQEATFLGIPVILIDPQLRFQPALWETTQRESPGTRRDLSLLRKRLRRIFEFPDTTEEVEAYRRFLQEKQPTWNHGFFYKIFCKFWVWDWPAPKIKIPNFQVVAQAAWKETRDTLDLTEDESNPLAVGLIKPFSWADGLAEFYANKYRSSFVATYILGAFAILFAYFGSAADVYTFPLLELSLILAIIFVTIWGRRKLWHKRWTEYRSLAENLRQIQFLSLLGRTLSSLTIPTHLEPGDPINKWFSWYFRALSRQTGLIQTRLDSAYLESYRQVLSTTLKSQLAYNKQSQDNYRKLATHLQLAAHVLFFLALLCCIGHIAFHSQGHIQRLFLIFNLGTIVFPAFAGAFGAILHSGEFERIATRSGALTSRLESLAWQLRHMQGTEDSRDLGVLAQSVSEIALAEHIDWRFTVMHKDLELPA